jgi:aryl-alcohol dehydrogenase-like predicted oxidoreductase
VLTLVASSRTRQLAFGCWQLGSTGAEGYWGLELTQPMANELVASAVKAGITYMDSAEDYAKGGSERQLGEALRSLAPEDRAKVLVRSSP